MKLVIYVLALAALLVLGTHYASDQMGFVLSPWRIYTVVGFFSVLTLISTRIADDTDANRPQQKVNRLMGGIVIKLFSGFLLFIVIALISPKDQILPFGILFLISYILFSILGSGHLIRSRG